MGDAVRWSGAVLCGGRSRRMGRDKALIPVGGQPMALRVASALTAAGAREVVAVGGDTERLSALGLDVVRDATVVGEPGGAAGEADPAPSEPAASGPPVAREGPLVGIVTALAALTTEIVVVVACDLVSPSAEAMTATVAALAGAPGYDLAVPYAPADRPGELVPQWLHAAWQREAWSSLAGQVAAGERAVHRAVVAAGLRALAVEGLPTTALADADVPADLPRPAGGHGLSRPDIADSAEPRPCEGGGGVGQE